MQVQQAIHVNMSFTTLSLSLSLSYSKFKRKKLKFWFLSSRGDLSSSEAVLTSTNFPFQHQGDQMLEKAA